MAWQVNPDGIREHLEPLSPLEMFHQDPNEARRIFEFQRAMQLAPTLRHAALRHLYARPGSVESGEPVVQPFLDMQDRAIKAGFNPLKDTKIDQAMADQALLTGADPLGLERWMMKGGTLTAKPRPTRRDQVGPGPQPAFRRNAAGVLSPGAGNYGVFSAVMQQLGLPGSGFIPGKGAVTVQDAVAAAQRLGQAGGDIPDVPIPEIQALRQRRAAEAAQRAAEAAQMAAQDEERRRSAQSGEEHRRKLELEQVRSMPKAGTGAEGMAIEDWRQDAKRAIEDQALYDRLQSAASRGMGLGDPMRSDYVYPDAVKARLQGLHQQYGGRPTPPATYEEWKARAARRGDPRFARDAGQQDPSGGGIMGMLIGSIRRALGSGRNNKPSQQKEPPADKPSQQKAPPAVKTSQQKEPPAVKQGQQKGASPRQQGSMREQEILRLLRSRPVEEQRQFLEFARKRNPQAADRLARELGLKAKNDG